MNKDYKFIKEAYEGKHGSICQEWKDTILKHYPEFNEEKLKVGDWIVITERYGHLEKGAVCRIRNWQCEKEQWPLVDQHPFSAPFRSHYRKATKEEILSHLSKEADKRGYSPGVSIVSLGECWVSEHCKGKEAAICENINFDYDYADDLLWVDVVLPNGKHNNLIIYEKGQWAEIINTITKEEAEKKLGMKII